MLYKTLHSVFVMIISSHFSILEMNRIAYHLYLSILLQSLRHRCPCVQLSCLACYHPILVWHGKALQSMPSVLSPVLRGSSWRPVPDNFFWVIPSGIITLIWKENICWRKTLSIRPFSAEAYRLLWECNDNDDKDGSYDVEAQEHMGCWSVCQTLLSHAHNSPSKSRVEEDDYNETLPFFVVFSRLNFYPCYIDGR